MAVALGEDALAPIPADMVPADSLGPPVAAMQTILTEDVSDRVCRGVSARIALEKFGRHWGASPLDEADGNAMRAWNLSQEVAEIHKFLSHDWKTRRWLKFLTLCYVYNIVPALVASYIAAAVSALLQSRAVGLLPMTGVAILEPIAPPGQPPATRIVSEKGIWPLVAGAVAFTIVFFFWQQIAHVLRIPKTFVFLDKLCIHQADPELKAAGVLGLAGILKRSRQLTVIWSPRYFTRLWCVYEVASWIYLGKVRAGGCMTLLPAALGPCMLALQAAILGFEVMFQFVGFGEATVIMPIVLAICLGITYVLLSVVRANKLMQDQVRNFSVRDAECYCCSNHHEDPLTGKELPCDRKLVYQTLHKWFGGGSLTEEPSPEALRNSLDRFDRSVHTLLPRLLTKLDNSGQMYVWAVTIMSPSMWEICCRSSVLEQLDWVGGVRFIAYALMLLFVVAPMMLMLMINSAWLVHWLCGDRCCLRSSGVQMLLLYPLVLVILIVAVGSHIASYATDGWGAQVLVGVVNIGLSGWLFRRAWLPQRWMDALDAAMWGRQYASALAPSGSQTASVGQTRALEAKAEEPPGPGHPLDDVEVVSDKDGILSI